MGGSGGFLGSIEPEEFIQKMKESEKHSNDSEFNTQVNAIISELLRDINNRPIEAIQKHLSSIKQALSNDIAQSIDLIFGGSVSKHTYVNGLSDVDSLAIINNTDLANKSPHEILDLFLNILQKRLPNTEITKGKLAVTIKYSDDIEIQILPALQTENGLKIPNSSGKNEWSKLIKPKKFAEKLTDTNSINNQKVVPIIKLAKSLISDLPLKRQISGYHTESLAIEAFNNYSGPKSHKEMLKHFFSTASVNVLKPIKDKTGQSIHVDDYLGESNSIQRQIVSDSFAQIVRKMNNADRAGQIDYWSSILK